MTITEPRLNLYMSTHNAMVSDLMICDLRAYDVAEYKTPYVLLETRHHQTENQCRWSSGLFPIRWHLLVLSVSSVNSSPGHSINPTVSDCSKRTLHITSVSNTKPYLAARYDCHMLLG